MGEDGKRGKIKRGSLLLGAGAGVGQLGMGMISVCKNWIILPTAFRRHTHTHTGRSRLRPRCSKRKLRWKLGHRRCRGDATKGSACSTSLLLFDCRFRFVRNEISAPSVPQPSFSILCFHSASRISSFLLYNFIFPLFILSPRSIFKHLTYVSGI